jgi:drug/metabolite transporter (DMT)-like permease
MLLLTVWIVYLLSDVYGHVALKMAMTGDSTNLWQVLFSFWGITAGLAWFIAGLSWMFVLSKHPLLTANTVAALTYILIALAAAVIFRESLTRQNVIGMVCVCVGIYLVTKS